MEIKYFNRKILFRILYALIMILIAAGTALLIYTFLIENWSAVGMSLMLFSSGIMALLGIRDKNHDIIIDYTNKEVTSNLKFGKKESFSFSFESINNIYIYQAYLDQFGFENFFHTDALAFCNSSIKARMVSSSKNFKGMYALSFLFSITKVRAGYFFNWTSFFN